MVSYLATATVAASLLASVPQSPEWQSDYGKSLEATRTDNRPLLVVVDKPAQQGQALDAKLLQPQEADNATTSLLGRYQLCHVDATTPYGKKVADAFEAKEFPYVAIIDKTGSFILNSHTGTLDASAWNSMLTSYQQGERPVQVSSATSGPIETQSFYRGGEATSSVSVGTGSAGDYIEYAQPVQSTPIFQTPSQPVMNNSYCPSCQRRQQYGY